MSEQGSHVDAPEPHVAEMGHGDWPPSVTYLRVLSPYSINRFGLTCEVYEWEAIIKAFRVIFLFGYC